MPFLSPNQQCQSTEGKISHSMDLLTPNSPGGLPTLSLTTNSSWLPWGRVAMPLIGPLMPVPHNLLTRIGFLRGVFPANHLASTHNLTRTTIPQKTYQHNDTQKNKQHKRTHTHIKPMLRETERPEPGLVAFYGIRQGNTAGLFLQSRSPHEVSNPRTWLAVWCSGNALVSINAVALHRARLVLGWVTAFGQVNCLIT